MNCVDYSGVEWYGMDWKLGQFKKYNNTVVKTMNTVQNTVSSNCKIVRSRVQYQVPYGTF